MKIRHVYEIFSSLFQESNQESYLREPNTYFLFWKTAWWVFVRIEQKSVSVYFQKIIFGNLYH
jgi:hypothetical protein